MKKALLVFLIVLLLGSINAGAIYFFDPVEYGKVTYVGGSAVGFPSEKGEMTLFSTEKTFEEVVLEGWAAFAKEIDVSEFEIKKEELADLYYDVINNNPSYDYVRKLHEYCYYTDEDGNDYITSIVPYYFSSEKTFEETILEGWSSFSKEIDVSGFEIKLDDMIQMYEDVFFDNPLFYYIDREKEYGYNLTEYYNGDTYVHSIFPEYTTTDSDEIAAMHKAIDEETDNILLYIENDMTDFEKVMEVHDYMVLHYDYDWSEENENHTITIMVTKTGVCESYALTFNYIMNIVGVESVIVTSAKMQHAWNLVKVDGKWYHIDVTWDDPKGLPPDQVYHQFELLSDERIQSMEDPHFGYDTGGRVADSDRFDYADWHENHSQIVSINNIDYWVRGNNIVDGDGNVIYGNLDGGDGYWSIGAGKGYRGTIYAGLAEFSGLLYFNTDDGIYSYNPKSEQIKLIEELEGICGMYIDNNVIRYCKYNFETGKLYEAGNMVLNGIRYAIPYMKDGKVIAEVFNGSSEAAKLFTFGDSGCEVFEVKEGINTFELSAENKFMYIWDSNLRPLRDRAKLPK